MSALNKKIHGSPPTSIEKTSSEVIFTEPIENEERMEATGIFRSSIASSKAIKGEHNWACTNASTCTIAKQNCSDSTLTQEPYAMQRVNFDGVDENN